MSHAIVLTFAETTIDKVLQQAGPDIQQRARSAVDVLRICMEHVNDLNIPGREKADLVKALLASEELRSKLPEKVVHAIDVMIAEDLVQSTIDVIVDASKGKLKLRKVAVCCLSFLAKWLEPKAAS